MEYYFLRDQNPHIYRLNQTYRFASYTNLPDIMRSERNTQQL